MQSPSPRFSGFRSARSAPFWSSCALGLNFIRRTTEAGTKNQPRHLAVGDHGRRRKAFSLEIQSFSDFAPIPTSIPSGGRWGQDHESDRIAGIWHRVVGLRQRRGCIGGLTRAGGAHRTSSAQGGFRSRPLDRNAGADRSEPAELRAFAARLFQLRYEPGFSEADVAASGNHRSNMGGLSCPPLDRPP